MAQRFGLDLEESRDFRTMQRALQSRRNLGAGDHGAATRNWQLVRILSQTVVAGTPFFPAVIARHEGGATTMEETECVVDLAGAGLPVSGDVMLAVHTGFAVDGRAIFCPVPVAPKIFALVTGADTHNPRRFTWGELRPTAGGAWTAGALSGNPDLHPAYNMAGPLVMPAFPFRAILWPGAGEVAFVHIEEQDDGSWHVWLTGATDGYWTLFVDGTETGPISWDALNGEVESVLSAILGCSVTGLGKDFSPFVITVTEDDDKHSLAVAFGHLVGSLDYRFYQDGIASPVDHCREFTFCNPDNSVETVRMCPTPGVLPTVVSIVPNCCYDSSINVDGTGSCAEHHFTLKANSFFPTSGGALACFAIDQYCLSGPTTVDAGDGVECQQWTGSTSLGTIILTKCATFWCLSGEPTIGDGGMITCGAVDSPDPCEVTTQFDANFSLLGALFGVRSGLTTTITVTAESCGPKCWQNHETLIKFCSGADETDTSTDISGPYDTYADCADNCKNFKCWTLIGSVIGDPSYRYCSPDDNTATSTVVSESYPTTEDCEAVCAVWKCWRQNSEQTDWGRKFCSQTDNSATADFVGAYTTEGDCTAGCTAEYWCWQEESLGLWLECSAHVPDNIHTWTQTSGPYDSSDCDLNCSKWYCCTCTAFDGLDCTGSVVDTFPPTCVTLFGVDALCANGNNGPGGAVCSFAIESGVQSVQITVLDGPFDTEAECEAACGL